MFKLRSGYLLTGIVTGLILLFNYSRTLPDGKLHLVFCDVGQGDAAYVKFPDGRDMLIDGGPNNQVLKCLSNHMPFWDREIDLVVLTHPQKDHLQGLLMVLERYKVNYFLRSEVVNSTEGFQQLIQLIQQEKIKQKLVAAGEQISVGNVILSVLSPSTSILGASTDINDLSVVVWLRYATFDALFPGDARLSQGFDKIVRDVVEVLKVPHHGSKTGLSQEFLDWLKPRLAVISVGKNSYGHPAEEILEKLKANNIKIRRTDLVGSVEVLSDGANWSIK